MSAFLPVAVPMLVFTLLVALLSAAVLQVRRRVAVREPVKITINGQRTLEERSGDSLLATLARAGIQLPSACGGRGTCGQCRVIVRSGGGALLPTELAHVNRRDAAGGARLACMLKVHADLDVTVPAAVLEARSHRCRVVSNRNLSTYLTELTLSPEHGASIGFRAGDYVLLTAPAGTVEFSKFDIDPEYRQEWQRHRLFDYRVEIPEPTARAYSIANAPAEAATLVLVVRIALPPPNAPRDSPPGRVSSFVFGLRPGDEVEITGPFGDFHARETDREMVLIGGGAGIAPLRAIVRDQLLGRATRRNISFWYGSRNLRELVYRVEFEALARRFGNFHYHVSLSSPEPDDDWDGPRGLIHTVVYEHYLQHHPAPEQAEYYLCGPPLMSSAVLAMLEDLGVDRENVLFDDFGTTGGKPS